MSCILFLLSTPNTYDLANDDHNLNAVRLNGPTPQATCYLLSGLNPARSYLNGPNLNDSPQPLVLLHGPNPLDTTPPALSTHPPQPSGLTFSSLTLGKIPTSPATSASTTTHPLRSYTHPTMTIPPQRPPTLIPDIINILLPNNGLISSSIVALSTASLQQHLAPTTTPSLTIFHPPEELPRIQQNLFFDGLNSVTSHMLPSPTTFRHGTLNDILHPTKTSPFVNPHQPKKIVRRPRHQQRRLNP